MIEEDSSPWHLARMHTCAHEHTSEFCYRISPQVCLFLCFLLHAFSLSPACSNGPETEPWKVPPLLRCAPSANAPKITLETKLWWQGWPMLEWVWRWLPTVLLPSCYRYKQENTLHLTFQHSLVFACYRQGSVQILLLFSLDKFRGLFREKEHDSHTRAHQYAYI